MNKHKGYTPFDLFFSLAAIASLAFGITAVWVIWHFIAMYW